MLSFICEIHFSGLTPYATDVVVGGLLSNRIGEDDAHGSLVIGLSDILKSLLSSSIPDLQLEALVLDLYGLDLEINSNRGDVVLFELLLAELHEDVGLADTTIPDDD